MAYNAQDISNKILKLKNEWAAADTEGDRAKANQIAKNAQSYYKQLIDNGDSKIADTLSNSNYEQSKQYINDYFAKQGKNAIRPYFYGLGTKYGLSQSDIDNALSFDNMTGEVTFAGKNLGKPSAISSDGVSYWDSDVLDNAFNDYISRTGTTRSKTAYVDQMNEDYVGKLNQAWNENLSDRKTVSTDIDDLKTLAMGNPFDTDEAKAILGKYDLSAIQGRNNQLAAGAASNGGNIDSYSAANAMRQQASLYSMGQQAVLDAYNSKVGNMKDVVAARSENAQNKIDNARQLLSDMGVQIDRVFNQDETAKNNQVSRDVATAEVTGKVPSSMLYSNNPLFNSDGTLKYPNIDYKAEIGKAVAAGNTELAEQLRVARGYKIFSDYEKYGQYADGDYTVPGEQKTETARQFDEQIASTENLMQMENQHEKDMVGVNTDAAIKVDNAQTDNDIRYDKANAENQAYINSSSTNDSIRQTKAENEILNSNYDAQTNNSSNKDSGAPSSSITADKISNDTDAHGRFNVNGVYYTIDEILKGLSEGTMSWKDEGDGKIAIYSSSGAFIG